jgi:large subunit ribosomal protein L15
VKLHHLHPAEGAKTERTRVGRGRSGRRGKTAGRGTKGTGARKNVPAYFEGGQMPYQRRVPKLKGFSNPNRVEYAPVNVEVLATYFDGDVSPGDLYAHGLAHKGAPVKILGRGEIDKALTVKAHAFSATAKAKIEAAGGTVETLTAPGAPRKPRKAAEG